LKISTLNRPSDHFVIASETTLFYFLALCVLAASNALAAGHSLKVMSFNVRFSYGGLDEAKTENNWADAEFPRRERVLRVIRDYEPDLLGVQEARNLQIVDLEQALPEYDFYGLGRDDGKKEGEYAGIYFRKDRFQRNDVGSFWLSDTPEKPGTTFYKAADAVPRMASWVKLCDKASCRQLVILNTHWDHISDEARRKSAKLIRLRLSSISHRLPTIVMGDLNVPEDAPAFKELLGGFSSPSPSGDVLRPSPRGRASDRTLLDSYRKLNPNPSPDEASYNDWQGTTAGSRIDFILHTRHFTPTAAEIVRTNYDGHWPSDHYPVTATLRW
jgi:endonuclease/exonuclease/phosphatase family metal-dependent hydrolase